MAVLVERGGVVLELSHARVVVLGPAVAAALDACVVAGVAARPVVRHDGAQLVPGGGRQRKRCIVHKGRQGGECGTESEWWEAAYDERLVSCGDGGGGGGEAAAVRSMAAAAAAAAGGGAWRRRSARSSATGVHRLCAMPVACSASKRERWRRSTCRGRGAAEV